jgi:aspartyl-tRNA(Asn)/glutamyl-tRNA(Gln) amidotransferase subunit B
MDDYKMTIGLEIHAELKTKTKMFCGCLNTPDEKNPNLNICPVCMGYPGTLPVINKEAVRKVLLVGSALGSTLADFTEFDRKNYFYPDIPKGYQISQYKYPLVSGGELAGVKLTRIHLEEDTARSSHDTPGVSLVDYNRAGVPLMELVTEPVIHSAQEVMNFAQELQLLLRYLDVSSANMEKGEMRVEVNISISKTDEFGTKVEVKNINSFKAAGRAVKYEFERQKDLLERGEKVIQETRGFDENKGVTFSQRSKESAHDYRYFPEPDLPKLVISEIPELSVDKLKLELPELPWQKRERFENKLGLKKDDVEIYVNNPEIASFFEQATEGIDDKNILQTSSNYITSDMLGLSKSNTEADFDFGKIKPLAFNELMTMQNRGDISSRGVKDILKIMFDSGGSPTQIAKENNLIQKNNPEEFRNIIQKIIADNPKVVADYKSGKESVLQFFVGQGMKESKGGGNPGLLKKLVIEILNDE